MIAMARGRKPLDMRVANLPETYFDYEIRSAVRILSRVDGLRKGTNAQ